MLIDQAGLGRATVIAAAAQIILLTGFGAVFGEAVSRYGWLAAGLACLAVVAASLQAPATVTPAEPPETFSNPSRAPDALHPNTGGH